MSLISQIRERTSIIIGAIAVGLVLFLLGGDLLSPTSTLFRSDENVVGEISGRKIEYQEFVQTVSQLEKQAARNSEKALDERQKEQIKQQAWFKYLSDIAYEEEYEKLGLSVTEEELIDMLQGDNIHPMLRQQFTDPNTGEFNRAQLIQLWQNFDQVDPSMQQMLRDFVESLIPTRKQTKYQKLLEKTAYVTTAEAQRQHIIKNAKANLDYLFVSYRSIADSTISVSEEEMKNYYTNNTASFEPTDSRSFKYISFPIAASSSDSAYWKNDLKSLRLAFEETNDDTAFVKAHSDGSLLPRVVAKERLPYPLSTMNVDSGKIFGPMLVANSYKLYKTYPKEKIDSVKAQHILISKDQHPDAEGKALADSILDLVNNGADFSALAKELSEGPSAKDEGDLGWFTREKMVAPFSNAAFGLDTTGIVDYTVKSQFGYHIIKVNDLTRSSGYYIAEVERTITPLEQSVEAAYKKAEYFAAGLENLEQFEEKVAADSDLVAIEIPSVSKNSSSIRGIPDADKVIKWAFADAEVGDVSDAIEVEDNYVVAALTGMKSEDDPDYKDFKDQIMVELRKEKKASTIKEQISSLSGELAAKAKAYGEDADFGSQNDLAFSTGSVSGIGFDPKAVGITFGLKEAEEYGPAQGENGVYIIKNKKLTPATEVSEYSSYESEVKSKINPTNVNVGISEVIQDVHEVEDYRYKFF